MPNSREPDDREQRGARVNSAVYESEMYLKGEPRGSVPLSRTMKKPEAYKATKGPK
jgi:hypothetical protein